MNYWIISALICGALAFASYRLGSSPVTNPDDSINAIMGMLGLAAFGVVGIGLLIVGLIVR